MNEKNMKSARSSFEYRDDRARDLHEVFKRELGLVPGENMLHLLQRVVNSPSRRFWVSEERAFRIVSSMMRRGLPPHCPALKREMFEEIARRAELLLKVHPDWPLSRRVYYVVNGRAPKFYISVKRAHAIICKERVRCEKERMLSLLRHCRSLSA